MARIFTLGESLLDIIFRDIEPVSAKAGGSMLNSSVSLGRLGSKVNFVSDYGIDHVGNLIDDFLHENNVNTNYVERFEVLNTPIALAFLDKNNDASYSFYKQLPEKRLSSVDIDFMHGDILLFGSFFAIADSVRESLLRIITAATKAGVVIVYDPNIRSPHKHEMDRIRPLIIENMNFADIIRGSDQDFEIIFGANSANAAYDIVKETGCRNLIYTSNKNGVDILTTDHNMHLTVPQLKTVSTIGAGDNFNAGLVWTIYQNKFSKTDLEHLPQKLWEKMGNTGIAFASDVCMSYDNYISKEFAASLVSARF